MAADTAPKSTCCSAAMVSRASPASSLLLRAATARLRVPAAALNGCPTLAWGRWMRAERPAVFVPWSPVLHALAEPIDDAGNVACARIAPSAGGRQPGARRNEEATLDQLHRVEGAEQVCGAVDTL